MNPKCATGATGSNTTDTRRPTVVCNRNILMRLCLINKAINHEKRSRGWIPGEVKQLQESAAAWQVGTKEKNEARVKCWQYFHFPLPVMCMLQWLVLSPSCNTVTDLFTWSSGSTSAPFFSHDTWGLGSPHTVHVKLRVWSSKKRVHQTNVYKD